MPKPKSYHLACPIARALDRVGDRWTLLILRDLHAGPARFSEILEGLPGLTTNLLSTRLGQLQDDGLVEKYPLEGATVYALTKEGARTAPLLLELSRFGAHFKPPKRLKPPGHLRSLAVIIREALARIVSDQLNLQTELIIDDTPFAIRVIDGKVSVHCEPLSRAPLSLSTSYEAMLKVTQQRGDISSYFQINRGTPSFARQMFRLLSRALGGSSI